ncbi:hypothetical protein EYC79_07510 [Agrobacterium cavarae]|uniref:Uncharacterized protein n=1 Tax=Agrobacterium cavarae TaxID=2528239 RepID=A0ABY1YBX0_9HYPH|nr:hypothetical protein [Agrobacterium cavarae]TBN14861.1 hypothetical protein EYC79_07510 [Agrobacterium cavarae]
MVEPREYSEIEQEAIVLGAVLSMVDDMVNHAIFCPLGEKRHDTNLLPQSSGSLRQFGTLLRDFLSPVTSKGGSPLPFGLPKPAPGESKTDYTTLYYLKRICMKPLIGTKINHLSRIVEEFSGWLDTYAFVENVRFGHIEKEVDLRIRRIDFIRMSGDIGKHNFLRLGGQAHTLRRILAENHVEIDEGDAYLALPDCWDWFHTHLLAYHASTIAEFLNNIRYAIRLYIHPEAMRRFRVTAIVDGLELYTFERPDEIVNKFAWAQFFELMQTSRKLPNFPHFTVAQTMKMRF